MRFNCQYCGKGFDTVNERGVHISKNHIRKDENIEQKDVRDDDRKNILEDWKDE